MNNFRQNSAAIEQAEFRAPLADIDSAMLASASAQPSRSMVLDARGFAEENFSAGAGVHCR